MSDPTGDAPPALAADDGSDVAYAEAAFAMVPRRVNGIPPRLTRLLPAIALAIVWASAVALSYRHGRDILSYNLMSDEMLWSGLALRVAEDGVPSFRGSLDNFNVLYAYLTAPAYLLGSMPDALSAARLLGALWMASAVVPVYLLARRLVEERWIAVLAAALSVAVPWLALSAMLLTETVAYPAFAWAVLACHHAMTRYGVRADLVALAGIALAFLARTQLVLLLPILAGAIALHEVGMRAPGLRAGARAQLGALRGGAVAAVRGHPLLAAAIAVGILVLGFGPSGDLLGSYGTAAEARLFPAGWLGTSIALLDLVAVGIGLLPFVLAIAWALATLARPGSAGRHAFACLLIVGLVVLTVQAASFVVTLGVGGLQERYLLYAIPLLIVGMVAWFTEARRSWATALIVAVAVAAALGEVPWRFAANPDPNVNIAISPATGFHRVIDGQIQTLLSHLGLSAVATITVLRVGLVAAVLGVLTLCSMGYARRTLAALGAGLLLLGVLQADYVLDRAKAEQYTGIDRGAEGSWVDPLVPADATVGLVPWTVRWWGHTPEPWWDTELRNRTVLVSFAWTDEVQPVRFGNAGLELEPSGRLAATEEVTHLVTSVDWDVIPAGRRLGSSPTGYLRLIELDEPMRAEAVLSGFSQPDLRSRAEEASVIRVYGPPDARRSTLRRMQVALDLPAPEGQPPWAYELRSSRDRERGTLRPGEQRTATIDVCVPAGGLAEVSVLTRDPSGAEAEDGVRVREVTGRDVAGGCQPAGG